MLVDILTIELTLFYSTHTEIKLVRYSIFFLNIDSFRWKQKMEEKAKEKEIERQKREQKEKERGKNQ